jgi:hypothetical protein
MEVVAGAVVVTTVCVAAGYVSFRGAGAAAQVMTRMFDSPAKLGWPSGVQEDDDFHWQWSGSREVAGEDSGPEVVDLTDGTGPQPSPVARH